MLRLLSTLVFGLLLVSPALGQTCLSDSVYNWDCRNGGLCNPGSLSTKSGGDLTGAEWQTYYAGADEDGANGLPIVTCGELFAGVEYRVHVGPVQGPTDGYLDWQSAEAAGYHEIDLTGPAFSLPPEDVAWTHRHSDLSQITTPYTLLEPLAEPFDDHSFDYNSIPGVNNGFSPGSGTRHVQPVGYGDSNGYYLRRSVWHGPISCLVEQPGMGVQLTFADFGANIYNVGQFRLSGWGPAGLATESLLPPGTQGNSLTLQIEGHAVDAFSIDAKGDTVPYDLLDVCLIPVDTDHDGHANTCDGDFNQDGAVGGPDYGILLADYGGPDSGVGTDMNADGVVGGPDLGLFTAVYGGPPCP